MATAGAVGDECVEALLQRVESNLPIKTGEPSPLARRNFVHTQDCILRLCASSPSTVSCHVALVNGLIRILRQLVAEYVNNIGHIAPEVEENYRHSLNYLLETLWKCTMNSPAVWNDGDERTMACNLLVECAKLLSQFSDKPFWTIEIELIGKLVCELSRRSFAALLHFIQQLFVEERDANDDSYSPSPVPAVNDVNNNSVASFTLIQYCDLNLKQLNLLLRDFAERTRPSQKKSIITTIMQCAQPFAVLLWHTVDMRRLEFSQLYSSYVTAHERDEFFEPCARIFESCSSALSSEKGGKFGRQPFDKEKMRQQVWPLMMACIVFSPKLTSNLNRNEDAANFVESLRTKLKRNHEYEFVAPILARFCSSLARLPVQCRCEDLSKQLLPSVAAELKQFLLTVAHKPSKNMPQSLEDSCVQTLCICLNISVSESQLFKADDLIQELFIASIFDPLQGNAGPTIIAIALKLFWSNLDDTFGKVDTTPYRSTLSAAAGRRVATFFTQLTTHYLSTSQASSSSQSGGSGGSGSGYPSAVRVRSIKVQSRSDRPSVDDNNSPTTQSIVYFLELFIAAPKLVVLSAEDDPGLLNELIQSICGLLDKPMFKKCVRAIEQLASSTPLLTPTQSESRAQVELCISRLRMLCIPIDAFSKRMLSNLSPVMLTDFVAALSLLSSKLLANLTSLRYDSLAHLLSISNDQSLLKDTIQRFERALISRLWTTDTSTVIVILDCVANLCKIVDNICQGEDVVVMQICPNLHSYAEMSNEMRRQSVSLGRVALQKHVLTSLRTLRYPSPSVVGAWECVFMIWHRKSSHVAQVLKGGSIQQVNNANEFPASSPVSSPAVSWPAGLGVVHDASTSPGIARGAQRRPSNLSAASVMSPSADGFTDTVGSLDELLVEWSHLTYFLAALADAYHKHRNYQRKSASGNQTPHSTVAPSLSTDAAISKGSEDNLSIYVSELLRMLLHTSEEKYGARVERCVRESLGGDLRPPIQSIVIEEAHKLITKHLECNLAEKSVVVSEQNTLFVGHITLLFKMMLDKPSLSTRTDDKVSSTLEEMMSILGQYVRAVGTPKLHISFCSLLLAVLRRREEMGYRLETKFRAKVVDYLLNFPAQTVVSNELVLLQLKTMSTVLARFPLIMDSTGGSADSSSRLRLLKSCAEFIVEKSSYLYRNLHQQQISSDERREVDEQSLLALLNLLLFNGELGLGASLYLITAPNEKIRSSYLDALSRFIRQGISSSNASTDEGSGDEFASLAELVTMLDDRGELPVVMALVEVVPTYQIHDLARLLTHLFDAKHLLSQLVINVLSRELAVSPIDTVLRGSNLASGLLSYSFQTFGSYYIAETIGPIAKRLMTSEDTTGYEVNPEMTEGEVNIEENQKRLIDLTREVLNALVSNRQRFPAKLRSLCRCVYEVLFERFPQNDVVRLTGGTLVFLRFVNPFLTSCYEFGLCDRPSKHVQRAFTLVAKLLQSSANGQLLKEEFMKPLNEFRASLKKEIDGFVDYLINSDEGAASSPAASSLFLGECVKHSLHYFLYTNQERVADCLRERRLVGRKPLDRLESLLNKLGPVELSFYLASYSSAANVGSAPRPNSSYGSQNFGSSDRLEPQFSDQIDKLRDAKIFYQSGQSSAGHPVFYFIPKHSRQFLSDFGDAFAGAPGSDTLALLITTSLKPCNAASTKWELVVDLTQAPVGVLFKSDLLQKLSSIPDAVLANLQTIYIYQCAPVVADYARLHDRFVTYLRQTVGCRFVFPETLTDLRVHIPQLKLPQTTLDMDEDVQVFKGASKLSRHKYVAMNIQTNRCAIKVSTAERVRLFAGCGLFVVETFSPEDVESVQLDASKQQIVLSLRTEPVPVVLGHSQAADIYESLAVFRGKVAAAQQSVSRGTSAMEGNNSYHSRVFLTTRMNGTPAYPIRLRDVTAFLLATGLANLSSGVASVQYSALNLTASLCHRFDLHIEDDARLSNLLRIATSLSSSCLTVRYDQFFAPIWSAELTTRVSFCICQSAPWLMLDFIAACSYYLAAESQLPHVKAAICDCIGPWLDSLKVLKTADCGLTNQSSLSPSPLSDALTSLVNAFIDLPTNACFTKAVFSRLHDFFDVIFDIVSTQQAAIPLQDFQKYNSAVLILTKTAAADPAFSSLVLAKHIEELILSFPTKMTHNNHRLVFLVRVMNALLAEDIFEIEGRAELLFHVALSLVGSGVQVSGENIYSFLYNSVRSFSASFGDAQIHRSLSELCETKFIDLHTANNRNSTSAANLAGENWVALLEYLVDLVAVADKNTGIRWGDFCRRIIDTSLNVVSSNSNDHSQMTILAPPVREAVRILGLLSALPLANVVTVNTVVNDVEKILKILGHILRQQQLSHYAAHVSVGISGALSFFVRITTSIPPNMIVILGDFFWLALVFLLSDEPTIYADALLLVDAVITSLSAKTACPLETILSCFQRHESVFLNNFKGILPSATKHGLDMRDHIHFILARLLFKSVEHPDNAICSYASKVLLRLHQPYSTFQSHAQSSIFSHPSSESSRARTVVYSLVAHIINPDHGSRVTRRQTRGSSIASNTTSHSNSNNVQISSLSLANGSCGCWDDRLMDIEKLDADEKLLCCEFLFALLLAFPKNSLPQQPIIVSIARMFAASSSCDANRTALSSLTRVPEIKTRLADLLRTTHDPDILTAAQGLLEYVAPRHPAKALETSSLFASLHRIPITFASSTAATALPNSNGLPVIVNYYSHIANIIFEGCLENCLLPPINKKVTGVEETQTTA